MDDLISRDGALGVVSDCGICIQKILDIPEVDVRPIGYTHWIFEKDRQRHWHCANCGEVWGATCAFFNYCPNCGFRVRRKKENESNKEVLRDM